MSAPARCTFRILGTVEVEADGRRLDVAGKPAAVLAVLLLHAPEAVSAERLVDALWDGHPPPTARKSVHVHVSRLRKVLPPGVVLSEPHGYGLRDDGAFVDLVEFRRLVDRGQAALEGGDPGAASSALSEALGLWRGPALAGLEAEPFASAEAARLEEERLAALELRIEADLALGRHARLAAELNAHVARHPFREGFRRQLMLALYRSGRQADALAAYRDARRTLFDELGLEPSPELRELEAAVLRQDPSLDAPARVLPTVRGRRRAVLGAVALGGLAFVGLVAAWRAADGENPAPPVVVANSVVRIDPRTGEILGVTRVGRSPDQLAVGPGSVWVVNKRDRTVSRVTPGGSVDTVGGVPDADHLAVDRGDVWVSSFDHPTVARIDGATLEIEQQIGVPASRAEGLAVGGGHLWVTNPASTRGVGTETVSRVDLRSGEVVSTVAVGKTPIFTTFGYGAVWVSNYDDGTVSVISPGSRKAETIRACNGPLGIAAGAGAIWVVCYWTRQLVRIEPTARRVVTRIPVGEGPLSVAVGEGRVWVTNRDSRTVLGVDPRSNAVVRTVRFPPGVAPYGVVVGIGAVWASVAPCDHPPCF